MRIQALGQRESRRVLRRLQVEARLPGLNTSEEHESGEWTSSPHSDADVLIVGEVESHNTMRANADKRFIVLQAPSHASLSESDEHYGTCVI